MEDNDGKDVIEPRLMLGYANTFISFVLAKLVSLELSIWYDDWENDGWKSEARSGIMFCPSTGIVANIITTINNTGISLPFNLITTYYPHVQQ